MHYAGQQICTLRVYFLTAEVVLFIIQLSTIRNIHQLFYSGETCTSSFYYLYKWLFYVGLIADSGLTCQSVKRLLTLRIDLMIDVKLRPLRKTQNLANMR
jgi:hypothetical protein